VWRLDSGGLLKGIHTPLYAAAARSVTLINLTTTNSSATNRDGG
jgi:hypothetical protein